MSTPSKDLIEVEGAIRTIIETLIDSQEGFQKIGEELKDEKLKLYFLSESLKRAEFRGDLEEILHQEGVRDIKESGTAVGTFTRVWGDLKSKLGGGDHALLESAEAAEDAVKQAYSDALEKFLPEPIREILIAQAGHVLASHDYVKVARDRSAQA